MPAPSAAIGARKRAARSRITNGTAALPDADGRSAMSRRYRDVVALICADQGGAERLAEVRLQMIRRFAACCVIAEGMEAKLAAGETIDVGEHALLTSSMVRVAQRIGIDRRAREILPSLGHYLEAKATSHGDDAEPTDAE